MDKLSWIFAVAIATFINVNDVNGQDIELGEILVSGGRTPIERLKSGRAYTVISEKQIKQRNITKVADALRLVPGLSVTQTGGAGGATAVRVRGSQPNHVLVMIDGIETAGAAGGFEFGNLTTDDVERIEVLRGPQSALWGAGATAGVINIVTKSGKRNQTKVTGFVEGASNASFAGGASLFTGNDYADLALSIAVRNEQGWNAASKGDEKDGYRFTVINAKGNIDLSDNLKLKASGRINHRKTEYDDTRICGSPRCYVIDANNNSTGLDFVGGVSLDYSLLGERLVLTPSLSYASETIDRTSTRGLSDSKQTTFKFSQQASYAFGAKKQHQIIGAFEFKRETFTNSYAGGDLKSRNQTGYVIEYRGNLTDELFVQLGGRFDDNQKFNDAFTWAASTSYGISQTDSTLHASIGKGITNPTFFELFGFIPGRFVGNSNLKPEENFGWDIGIRQRLFSDQVHFDVSYFSETLKNQISGTGKSARNLKGNSPRRGVEVSLTIRPVKQLTLTASYTYLDAKQSNGKPENRLARHSGALSIAYSFLDDRGLIVTDLIYNGSNYQTDYSSGFRMARQIKVKSRLRADVSASYKINQNLKLYGKIKNLFNSKRYEVLGYNIQPRTVYLGLKYVF